MADKDRQIKDRLLAELQELRQKIEEMGGRAGGRAAEKTGQTNGAAENRPATGQGDFLRDWKICQKQKLCPWHGQGRYSSGCRNYRLR